jgi:hypothetical protein
VTGEDHFFIMSDVCNDAVTYSEHIRVK